MRLSAFLSCTAFSALAFGCFSVASATPVITFVSQFDVALGGTAPGSASDYTFFGNSGPFLYRGPGGQPTDLTDFNVSTASSVQYGGSANGHGPYSTISEPGVGTFTTGIASSPVDNGGTYVIATFTEDSNGSFYVYILDGNTDGNTVSNSSVGLGTDGGTAVTTSSNATSDTNEFTEYLVTGATTSDTFQVYATGDPGDAPSIGGLTFSGAPLAPTPEPSALILLGTGILGVAGAARRKLRRS